ncbi:unnamed protein product [Oikopleura dioica]|uniref:Uncharacterized protein n=1 Tax=Oikopleura dioica TaxID=34765 RepID=E4XIR7_OIKDI|nr:unnamed protein product [Oikopleura dioica]CBY38582.1 unnamed protein product [Oikopleura dioica]
MLLRNVSLSNPYFSGGICSRRNHPKLSPDFNKKEFSKKKIPTAVQINPGVKTVLIVPLSSVIACKRTTGGNLNSAHKQDSLNINNLGCFKIMHCIKATKRFIFIPAYNKQYIF